MNTECDHGYEKSRDCRICHKVQGICEFGDCEAVAAWHISRRHDCRKFCDHHATDPRFQFARAGCSRRKLARSERIDNSERWEAIAVGDHWPAIWERIVGDTVWTATLLPHRGLRLQSLPLPMRGQLDFALVCGVYATLREIDGMLKKAGHTRE